MLASSARCCWISRFALCTKGCGNKQKKTIKKESIKGLGGCAPQRAQVKQKRPDKDSGLPLGQKGKITYMIRRRLRRSRCSLLGDDHSSLPWRGLRSIAPRGGHRLRGRGHQFRLPYGLLSVLIKRALRG